MPTLHLKCAHAISCLTQRRCKMKMACMLISLFILMTVFAANHAQAGEWFSCEPIEIMELSNRIHVKCANTHYAGSASEPRGRMDGLPGIRFIAVATRDRAKAERFVGLATAALACGYTFRVRIPASGQSNAEGCRPNDCRTPDAFGVKK